MAFRIGLFSWIFLHFSTIIFNAHNNRKGILCVRELNAKCTYYIYAFQKQQNRFVCKTRKMEQQKKINRWLGGFCCWGWDEANRRKKKDSWNTNFQPEIEEERASDVARCEGCFAWIDVFIENIMRNTFEWVVCWKYQHLIETYTFQAHLIHWLSKKKKRFQCTLSVLFLLLLHAKRINDKWCCCNWNDDDDDYDSGHNIEKSIVLSLHPQKKRKN